MSQAAADLRAAADHIDRVGLHQGGHFFANDRLDLPRSERACCALGGLGIITGTFSGAAETPLSTEDIEGHMRYIDAYGALAKAIGDNSPGSIVSWSDLAPDPAKVPAKMREVADALEETP